MDTFVKIKFLTPRDFRMSLESSDDTPLPKVQSLCESDYLSAQTLKWVFFLMRLGDFYQTAAAAAIEHQHATLALLLVHVS